LRLSLISDFVGENQGRRGGRERVLLRDVRDALHFLILP
jgi:hypothetical protein